MGERGAQQINSTGLCGGNSQKLRVPRVSLLDTLTPKSRKRENTIATQNASSENSHFFFMYGSIIVFAPCPNIQLQQELQSAKKYPAFYFSSGLDKHTVVGSAASLWLATCAVLSPKRAVSPDAATATGPAPRLAIPCAAAVASSSPPS